MSVSTRTRFEIFKRDGFRCRYCGAGPISSPLEVDHVVPVSKSGTDDAGNLVTACWDCNRGKSNVPLEESRLPQPIPAEALHAQADQIRAALAAQQDVEDARDEVREAIGSLWCRRHPQDKGYYPRDLYRKALGLLERYSMEKLGEAFAISACKCYGGTMLHRWQYAQGVLRKWRETDAT